MSRVIAFETDVRRWRTVQRDRQTLGEKFHVIHGIDHVQVTVPADLVGAARDFHCGHNGDSVVFRWRSAPEGAATDERACAVSPVLPQEISRFADSPAPAKSRSIV